MPPSLLPKHTKASATDSATTYGRKRAVAHSLVRGCAVAKPHPATEAAAYDKARYGTMRTLKDSTSACVPASASPTKGCKEGWAPKRGAKGFSGEHYYYSHPARRAQLALPALVDGGTGNHVMPWATAGKQRGSKQFRYRVA